MITRTGARPCHHHGIVAVVGATMLAAGCTAPPTPPAAQAGEEPDAAAAIQWGPVTVPMPGPPARLIATDGPGLDAPRAAGALPAHSPCLERAAAAQAHAATLLPRVPAAFTDRAVSWAGCPDAAVTVATVWTSEPERAILDEVLRRRLADEPWTHLGIARSAVTVDGRWQWFVLLVRRRVELQPVPSEVAVGARLTLQLRLDPQLSKTSVLVTRPDGEVEQAGAGSGGGWMVAATTLESVGRYWIEVFGEDRAGPEVLALFPVEVGRPSPVLWVGTIAPEEARHVTPAEAEAVSLRLVDETRARFGRHALERDPRLTEIARRYAEEQAVAGRIAHVSQTSGSVADRLRRGGYAVRVAAENLAQAGSIGDAHAALLRSPGHRAAMLDPYMTHVGIGVAWTEDRGQRSYFVTQIFALPLSRTDPAALAAAIRARIGGNRTFDAAATVAATAAIADGQLQPETQAERVTRSLAHQLPARVAITLIAGTAFDANDAPLEDHFADADVVGIGVAVGQPTAADSPLPYLIVVLTRR